MNKKRLFYSIRSLLCRSARMRADYFRKKKIFHYMGQRVSFQPKLVPLYPELISIGDNTVIASEVVFATHDVTHVVLRNLYPEDEFQERIGCINIGNNCFIGAKSLIMYGVSVGNNCIVGAGSIVNKDVPEGTVVTGVPARHIRTIDEYKNKVKLLDFYPDEMKPRNQAVSKELEQYMWEKFERDRRD